MRKQEGEEAKDIPIDILFKADGVLTADSCRLCGKKWGAPCVDIWYSKDPELYPDDRDNFIRMCLRCANAIVAECTNGLMYQLQDIKEGKEVSEIHRENLQTE